MIRRLYILLLVPLLFVGVSCTDKEAPPGLIAEDRYVEIFTHLVVINQITDDQLGEASRDSLIELVFEQNAVSRDQFNRSHHYYQRQPDRQLERIARVEEKIKLERDDFQERLYEKRRVKTDTTAVSDTL
ncbi:hypothetical protein BH23BAC3_BH23BAC3_31620 [soil metagenome]